LCFERRYPKQNSVIRLKLTILFPPIPSQHFWAGYAIDRTTLWVNCALQADAPFLFSFPIALTKRDGLFASQSATATDKPEHLPSWSEMTLLFLYSTVADVDVKDCQMTDNLLA